MDQAQRRRAYEIITEPPPPEELEHAGEYLQDARQAGTLPPLDQREEDALVARALAVYELGSEAPGDGVVPLAPRRDERHRRSSWTRGAVAGSAFAAALMLVVLRSGTGPIQIAELSGRVGRAPVMLGGEPTLLRPGETGVFTTSDILRIDLTLAQPTADKLDSRCYLNRRGQVMPWPVRLERDPDQSFHLQAPIDQLPDLGPGSFDLIVVIGLEGRMPTAEQVRDAIAAGPSNPPREFRIFKQPLEIKPTSRP